MFDWVFEIFTDYTLRTVTLGAAGLGLVSGSIGTFAVLRRQSLVGDAISHAALPGIAIAFLLTGSKAPLVLVIGAAMAGWLGTLIVMTVTQTSRVKYDAALGLMLSAFFGFGIVLLTYIQNLGTANQAGLDKFLFGQAAGLLQKDVVLIAVLGVVGIFLMILFWKEFKLLSFDRDFGQSQGFRMREVDILMTFLIVLAIVLGLQTVGVVLMSAILIAPAMAARQWTDKLSIVVLLAGLFGALAGATGSVMSSTIPKLPTGPTIVMVAGAIVFFSLLFAPQRGLVWSLVRRFRTRQDLEVAVILSNLYHLAGQHDSVYHPHSVEALKVMTASPKKVLPGLKELKEDGDVHQLGQSLWSLTEQGVQRILAIKRGEFDQIQ